MGNLAKLISFVRVLRDGDKLSDVELDLGGGNLITSEHASAPGDDSFPLLTDHAAVLSTPRTGGGVTVGYFDLINDPVAEAGDKRIYARDMNTGLVVNQVWLKSDGSILVSNDNGSFELEVGGNVMINGVEIDTGGNITTSGSVAAPSMVVDGKELKDHIHLAGTPPGNTGPNV